MTCSTNFTMAMDSNKMAAKALELMKEVLAQANADAFEYDCRETFDRFANNLVVKGSEIMDTECYGLLPETYHIILPEMFKAVARQFFFTKFSAHIFFESSYGYEEFDMTYEECELAMDTFSHDYCGEPSCEECDDYYEYFEEDGHKGYCCVNCGHIISV